MSKPKTVQSKYHVEVRWLGDGIYRVVITRSEYGPGAWSRDATDRSLKSTLNLAAKKRAKLEAA